MPDDEPFEDDPVEVVFEVLEDAFEAPEDVLEAEELPFEPVDEVPDALEESPLELAIVAPGCSLIH